MQVVPRRSQSKRAAWSIRRRRTYWATSRSSLLTSWQQGQALDLSSLPSTNQRPQLAQFASVSSRNGKFSRCVILRGLTARQEPLPAGMTGTIRTTKSLVRSQNEGDAYKIRRGSDWATDKRKKLRHVTSKPIHMDVSRISPGKQFNTFFRRHVLQQEIQSDNSKYAENCSLCVFCISNMTRGLIIGLHYLCSAQEATWNVLLVGPFESRFNQFQRSLSWQRRQDEAKACDSWIGNFITYLISYATKQRTETTIIWSKCLTTLRRMTL